MGCAESSCARTADFAKSGRWACQLADFGSAVIASALAEGEQAKSRHPFEMYRSHVASTVQVWVDVVLSATERGDAARPLDALTSEGIHCDGDPWLP